LIFCVIIGLKNSENLNIEVIAMKKDEIEDNLDRIIAIDEKAKALEEQKENYKKEAENALEAKKMEIEREFMREARFNAKEQRDKIYNEMKSVKYKINKKTDKQCTRLKYVLENNIEDMTEKIFNKIISNL
jgi:hypothetical protein